MCRIAGIVEKYPSSISKLLLTEMLSVLKHGGPDDDGVLVENGVHLGHRRLSILDLSPMGHQPMHTADGQVSIVFNGEIYNFQSIRAELQSKGYTFRSGSDTEIILYAWQEWGTKAFTRFNGMYAIALYDRPQQKIILLRDHAGIKPLYYAFQPGRLVFASEVRAFKRAQANWPENPDWRTLFLTFGSLPFPFTTLQGVNMLPKGSYLELDLETFDHQIVSFQKFSFRNQITDPSEAVYLMRSEIEQAVKRHLISDAPIGVFLSGGIDSSLLALVAHNLGTEQLRTISVTFNEATFDESPYQQLVLDRIHSQHTAYRVDDQMFLEHLEDVFNAMDQPSLDGVNTYFISKCAHENGLKAVLSGLGADEYFGGYGSFKRITAMNSLKTLPGKKWIAKGLGLAKDKWKRTAWLDLNNTVGDYLFLRGIFPPDATARLLGISEEEVWRAVREVQITDAPSAHSPNYASFIEANVYMENQLLKDSDYMSMWHGLEVRVPFLDKELVRLAMEIDPAIKFKTEFPKYLLSHTYRDLLPENVVFRKKQGFTFPLQEWLKRHHEKISDRIPNSPISRKIQKEFLEGKLHWSKYWALVISNKFSFDA